MPIDIQGPDGQRYRFPDGTTDDVMLAAMRNVYGGPTAAPSAQAPEPQVREGSTQGITLIPDNQPDIPLATRTIPVDFSAIAPTVGVGEGLMMRARAGIGQAIGGAQQMFGEQVGSLVDTGMAPFQTFHEAVTGAKLPNPVGRGLADSAAEGAGVAEQARIESKEAQAGTAAPSSLAAAIGNPGNALRYYGGLMAESAPMMAAAMATRNPAVATTLMGAGTAGQTYGAERADGATPLEAAQQAVISSGMESALGLGPFEKAMGAGSLPRRMLTAGATEASTEGTTGGGQQIASDAMKGKDTSRADINRAVIDSTIVGGGMGPGMAVLGSGRSDAAAENIGPRGGLMSDAIQRQAFRDFEGQLNDALTPTARPAPRTPAEAGANAAEDALANARAANPPQPPAPPPVAPTAPPAASGGDTDIEAEIDSLLAPEIQPKPAVDLVEQRAATYDRLATEAEAAGNPTLAAQHRQSAAVLRSRTEPTPTESAPDGRGRGTLEGGAGSPTVGLGGDVVAPAPAIAADAGADGNAAPTVAPEATGTVTTGFTENFGDELALAEAEGLITPDERRSLELQRGKSNEQVRQANSVPTQPGLQADQDARTISGAVPRDSWATATHVRAASGAPAVIFRGSRDGTTRPESFDQLGASTGNPSASLGVWFSNDATDASRYGQVGEYRLDLRNPKQYDATTLPEFESAEEAAQFREELKAQGHDGIVLDFSEDGGPVQYVAFSPDQIIPTSARRPLGDDPDIETSTPTAADDPLGGGSASVVSKAAPAAPSPPRPAPKRGAAQGSRQALAGIARSGGLNWPAFAKEGGLDPALMRNEKGGGGMPGLMRRTGGMTPDDLRQALVDGNQLLPSAEIADAMDWLDRTLRGENIPTFDTADAMVQAQADRRQARAEERLNADPMAAAQRARARKIGNEPAMEALADFDNGLLTAPGLQKRLDDAETYDESAVPFSRAPANQPGLLDDATPQERVESERQRRDDQRNGKAGSGRTDMASGDGDLFAGNRPDQSSLFSRTDKPKGIALNILSRVVRSLFSGWTNAPTVRAVQSVADVPADVRERARLDESEGEAEGFFDPQTETVWLIADALSTPSRARWVAYHEVTGHYGIRGVVERIGKGAGSLRKAFAATRSNPTIDKLARAIAFDRGLSDAEQSVATEEALAELSAAEETGDWQHIADRYNVMVPASMRPGIRGAIDRFVQSIKRLFSIIAEGRTDAFTDADWRELVRGAMRYGREGRAAESAPDGEALASQAPKMPKDKIGPDARAENFKRWSNNAPLVSRDDAMTYPFKSGQRVVLEAFHGTKRPDRIGKGFSAKRATSGPMSFFTSDPALASGYATGKADTSLTYEDQDFGQWFKVKVAGYRNPLPLDRAWFSLPMDVRARIAALAPRVRTDYETGENIELAPEGHTNGIGNYEWEIKQHRGNALKALMSGWLEGGVLHGEEHRFMDVLEAAGMPVDSVTLDSPFAEFPAVIPTYVQMQRPLVTNDIPPNVINALQNAAKRDRSRASEYGADTWDKNTKTLRQWFAEFTNPDMGLTEYAWTTIPDKVTNVLRSLGYDGIIDVGGKGGGEKHRVYIPFGEDQVKGVFNRGTFSADKPRDLLLSTAPRTPEQKAGADQAAAAGAAAPGEVTRGLSVPVLERLARSLFAGWANAPTVRVEAKSPDGKIEGRFDPATNTVTLYADALSSPARARWVAYHEVTGHYGVRGVLEGIDKGLGSFDRQLGRVRSNPTIDALARAIAFDRELDATNGRALNLATEEAMAELSAAEETGNWQHLNDRYGVTVPRSMRAGVLAELARYWQAIKSLFAAIGRTGTETFTDADWRKLVRDAMRHGREGARGERGAMQSAGAMASRANLSDEPFYSAMREAALGGLPLFSKAPADDTVRMSTRENDAYAGEHAAVSMEAGAASLDDLTVAFGEDIYGKDALQFFGSGDPREARVVRLLRSLRGKPDAKVTIYRGGVPAGATINAGDWVTLDRSVAEDYAELNGGSVVEKVVPASHVTAWADSLLENGYFPPQPALKSTAPFNESAFRPAVVSWAKSRFGDEVAPNGRPAWRNFVEWFGDSKVVDESGAPMVVYHGTAEDFDTFSERAHRSVLNRKYQGDGFHFSDDPGIASSYADAARNQFLNKAKAYAAVDASVPPLTAAMFKAVVEDGYSTAWDIPDADVRAVIDEADKAGIDINELLDIAEWVEGSNYDKGREQHFDAGMIFGGAAKWLPDYIRESAAKFGMADAVPKQAVIPVYLKAEKVLRTSSQRAARRAQADGYDGVYYTGPDTVRGQPEWIVFRPEQIKSATGNSGTFDATNPSILKSVAPRTPEQSAALTKAGLAPDTRTTIQRLRDLLAERWQAVRDLAAGNVKQRVFDRYHRMNAIEQDLGIGADESAYVSARLAAGLPSIMEGVMLYGAPEWQNGVLGQKAGTVGLLDALKPVQDDIDGWLGWMVGRRAQVLKRQGRENLMSDDDIAALLSLAQGKETEFKKAAVAYLTIKSAVLDVAEKAGLINASSRATWDSVEYIPFYRADEATDTTLGPGTRKALSGQSSGIRQLKGGQQNLADPLGNIVRNFTRLIDASLKNNAMLEAVDQYGDTYFEKVGMSGGFEKIPLSQIKELLLDRGVPQSTIDAMPQDALTGLQKMWAVKPPDADDVVRIMRDGRPEYYRVPDPELLRSLTSFKVPEKHWAIKPAIFLKRLLTAGVTASPEFMVRNYIRDSGSAWVLSDDKFRLGWDSAAGALRPLVDDSDQRAMMLAGGSFIGGNIHGGSPDETAAALRRALRKKGLTSKQIEDHLATVVRTPLAVWDKWQAVGSALENANRNAVYQAAIKAGRSPKEAAYLARDLMDFAMQGDSKFIQFFADVLPFFNARLQGLYKLYRQGGKKQLRKAMLLRAGSITTATVALWAWNSLMYADGYDELEEWDKDTYWHIAPGTAFHTRIPKPFELGVIFATAPERLARAVFGQDRLGQTAQSAWTQISGTLAMNPVPQAVMPIVELWANKSSFTGRPIESFSDQSLLPEARAEWYTSDAMKAIASVIGNTSGLSPKRLEHLWNGYTGTVGGYLLDSVDWLARQVEGQPERPELAWAELPALKALYRGDMVPKSTRYTTEFYDLLDKANDVSGTIKEHTLAGKTERADALEAKWSWLLGERVDSKRAKAGFMHQGVRDINKARDRLSDIRKEIEGIVVMPGMTDTEKRQAIDKLALERNALTKQITTAFRSRQTRP